MISVICKYQFSNLLFFCEKNIHLAQRQLTLASISSFNRVYFQETKVGSLKVKVKVEVKTCIFISPTGRVFFAKYQGNWRYRHVYSFMETVYLKYSKFISIVDWCNSFIQWIILFLFRLTLLFFFILLFVENFINAE